MTSKYIYKVQKNKQSITSLEEKTLIISALQNMGCTYNVEHFNCALYYKQFWLRMETFYVKFR